MPRTDQRRDSEGSDPPPTATDPKVEDFRVRNAKVKREKMLGRLLGATMEVCANTNRRGAAVIDDVVKAAGVSRGAFYWYFDSLDEAIEMLGRRMADEISAETYTLFREEPDPVLRAALGGQVMLCRAHMDRVWANYLSNVQVLLDDSRFVIGVRKNLELGREAGAFRFDSLVIASDFQIGAILGGVRRCTLDKPPSLAALVEMNSLTLRGLGIDSAAAADFAARAERILAEVGPANLPWWRDEPPKPARRGAIRGSPRQPGKAPTPAAN
jgi:AcrR family transcriptional regulator